MLQGTILTDIFVVIQIFIVVTVSLVLGLIVFFNRKPGCEDEIEELRERVERLESEK